MLLEYDIGGKKRKDYEIGLNISTAGTGKLSQNELEAWVKESILMSFNDTIKKFDLWNPELYRKIVKASDFFHNPEFPWNQKDNNLKLK